LIVYDGAIRFRLCVATSPPPRSQLCPFQIYSLYTMNFGRQMLRQVARGYATASAKVQPPLALHGIDGRYASALYTAAVKKGTLEAVENDLNRLSEQVAKEPVLQNLLVDPTQNRDVKIAGINKLLSKGKYSETTMNLMNLLAENGRLQETPKIIEAYKALMMAHRGEVLAVVTSAKPLDNGTLKQLRDTLRKSSLVESGKTLKIENKVNPAILGGLLVEVGDKTIDATVSSKVAKYSKLLQEQI
jgi:F-type H+-transporting ATPase subunit O